MPQSTYFMEVENGCLLQVSRDERQPQLEFRVCGRFGDTKYPCEVAISAERRCRLKSPKNGAKHGIIRRVPSVPPQSFRPGTNQAGRRHIAP